MGDPDDKIHFLISSQPLLFIVKRADQFYGFGQGKAASGGQGNSLVGMGVNNIGRQLAQKIDEFEQKGRVISALVQGERMGGEIGCRGGGTGKLLDKAGLDNGMDRMASGEGMTEIREVGFQPPFSSPCHNKADRQFFFCAHVFAVFLFPYQRAPYNVGTGYILIRREFYSRMRAGGLY